MWARPAEGGWSRPDVELGISLEAIGWTFTGATKQDPNALETAALTEAAGRQTLTIGTPAVASPLPDAALTYSIALRDIAGDLEPALLQSALLRWLVAAFAAPGVPVDMVLMAGLSAGGPPTAGRRGLAAGLVPNGGNWQALRCMNTAGAGWAAWVATTATSASTRMAVGALGPYSGWNSGCSFGVGSLDSAGAMVSGVGLGAATNAAGFGIAPNFDTAFIGIGWYTGVGGTAGAYTLAARFGALSVDDLPRMVPA